VIVEILGGFEDLVDEKNGLGLLEPVVRLRYLIIERPVYAGWVKTNVSMMQIRHTRVSRDACASIRHCAEQRQIRDRR
jgi:hypothetical protein